MKNIQRFFSSLNLVYHLNTFNISSLSSKVLHLSWQQIYYDYFLCLPCQCDLKDAVSSYVWGQASKALFPWSSDTHKQGITIVSSNDTWDLSGKSPINKNDLYLIVQEVC